MPLFLLGFSYTCLDFLDLFDWSFQSAPNPALQSPWNALLVHLGLQNAAFGSALL